MRLTGVYLAFSYSCPPHQLHRHVDWWWNQMELGKSLFEQVQIPRGCGLFWNLFPCQTPLGILPWPHHQTRLSCSLSNRWHEGPISWWVQGRWRLSSLLYISLLHGQRCGVQAGENKEANNLSIFGEGRAWLYLWKILIDICQVVH